MSGHPLPVQIPRVPLSVYKLKKEDLQAVADRLPLWKEWLMSRAGRTTLMKVTLSAIPVHVSIGLKVDPWIIRMVDKFRRAFIWAGSNSVQGGHCLVAWQKVTRPMELGGLGVLDLTILGYALRLWWEWQAKTTPDKPWASFATKPERAVQAMFEASVTVDVGYGHRALFWQDKWIHGRSLSQLAPDLVTAVVKHTHDFRVVADALHNDRWIADIVGSLSVSALVQYVATWERMQNFQLVHDREDKFIWKWSGNQQYSSSSAYRAFFLGQCSIPGAKELCKTVAVAPPRCKFFIWLALLGRCWTSDRLQRHQLQNNGPCALCSQADETIDHLTISCVFSKEVWFGLLRVAGFQYLTSTDAPSIVDWWLPSRKRVHKTQHKGFDSLFVLVVWSLWLERNARVFNGKALLAGQLANDIRDEGRRWVASGFINYETSFRSSCVFMLCTLISSSS
jgi:hypothetical protein